MKCQQCGAEIRVIDSRETETGIRRRRSCTACKYRFTTYELSAADVAKYEQTERKYNALKQRIMDMACGLN